MLKNSSFIDKNVADAAEYMRTKKKKGNIVITSNHTHCTMVAVVGKKNDEVYAVRNYVDILPGGIVKMGIRDTREKIAIGKGLILI